MRNLLEKEIFRQESIGFIAKKDIMITTTKFYLYPQILSCRLSIGASTFVSNF